MGRRELLSLDHPLDASRRELLPLEPKIKKEIKAKKKKKKGDGAQLKNRVSKEGVRAD